MDRGDAVLCNQLRTLDLTSGNAKFVEKVPDFHYG
jgi:hypothetical protein